MTTAVASSASSASSTGRPAAIRSRLQSIDIIRGAVMVLMAIDHVRVYSGLPAGGPTLGIFFTRWVTHFCAPAFVFLAGTGAYLGREKLGDVRRLSSYLALRGAWLILLELTVIRIAWTFNLDFRDYLLAGVIWMIGWSMILMAGLVHLPLRAIAAFGIVMIAGHNVLDLFAPKLLPAVRESRLSWLWTVIYYAFTSGTDIQLGSNGPNLVVLYSIVPWVGVMAAGYAFGAVMRMKDDQRRRWCLLLGLGATAAFLVLRTIDVYGDPGHWHNRPALAFLATTKYPASLLFLLMTLGPTIALIPLLERARGRVAQVLAVFGRVPLFYYLLHIPLIHALALLVSYVRLGEVSPWLFANHPMGNPPAPPGYTWSLPLLYTVTIVAVAILYWPCRWFADLKRVRREAWLSFL
jgi:uncharacterized membrane protein